MRWQLLNADVRFGSYFWTLQGSECYGMLGHLGRLLLMTVMSHRLDSLLFTRLLRSVLVRIKYEITTRGCVIWLMSTIDSKCNKGQPQNQKLILRSMLPKERLTSSITEIFTILSS